jgi:MFS family permease
VQNGIVMAFAVLYLPLVEDFGASRAEVATVQSAVLLLGGFGGPLVGWAFDRLGPRRLIQCGAVLAAAAFLAASRVGSLPALVAVYGVLGGLGLAAFGSQANMAIAALWYPRARGRAIAVADLGTGFGAFCFIPLGQWLVSAVGWRGTLVVWATLLLGLVVPLNAFQRLPAALEDVRRRRARATAPSGGGADWTLGAALRSVPFRWLAACRFFAACAFPLMNTHMVAYAVGQGIPPPLAATALGSVSLVSLAGRLTVGWLSDRLGRAPALTLAYTSAASGIGALSLLALTGWPGWLILYVLLYGLAQGSSGIVASARAADLFAGPSFGAIYGWLTVAVGPGEALGAWIGGKIYDAAGSYLGAFAFAVGAMAAGLAAIWRVRPEPRRST